MEITTPTSVFDFKSITLADPEPLSGHTGFYFTQLNTLNAKEEPTKKSLYLQLPECLTKQGVVDIKNAKYLDLMFDRDKHDELMHWIETLEYTCQDIIDAKKELWFQTDLTRDDIETMMTPIIRLYQSGKFMLMRVFIDVHKGGQKCVAYDEHEIGYDLDFLEANKKIIPLIMVEGVKFSARSFEISLKLVQVMVLDTCEKKSSCLIKRPTTTQIVSEEQPLVKHAEATKSVPLLTFKKQVSIVQQPQQQQAQVKPQQQQAQVKPQQQQAQVKPQQQAHTNLLQNQQSRIKPPNQVSNSHLVKDSNLISKTLDTVKPVFKNTTVGNTTVGNTTVGNTTVGNNLEKKVNDIEEVTLNYDDISDSISDSINLKNPNEVYYEIYKKAREKAKQCRINAIEAYLEAKQIKTKYMLNDLDDDSDDDEDSDDYEDNQELK